MSHRLPRINVNKSKFNAAVLLVFCIVASTNLVVATTWSGNEVRLTTWADFDGVPCIIQTSDRNLWLFWTRSEESIYNLFYMTSTNLGTTWSPETQLTTDDSANVGVSAVQAADGVIWVVWASDRTGNYDLYYKTSDDFGASWSENIQLTSGPKIDSNPQMLQTIDGQIWLVWSSRKASTTADDDIYYMYSTDSGATWSDSVQFTTNEYDDIWPSLVQTHLMRVWVVWTSNRADQPDGNWELYCKTSLIGDVNEDNRIDVIDLTIASLAYGSFDGEPGYNSNVDINNDGWVDMSDLVVIAYLLGET